jgi:hypothetical protein
MEWEDGGTVYLVAAARFPSPSKNKGQSNSSFASRLLTTKIVNGHQDLFSRKMTG